MVGFHLKAIASVFSMWWHVTFSHGGSVAPCWWIMGIFYRRWHSNHLLCCFSSTLHVIALNCFLFQECESECLMIVERTPAVCVQNEKNVVFQFVPFQLILHVYICSAIEKSCWIWLMERQQRLPVGNSVDIVNKWPPAAIL